MTEINELHKMAEIQKERLWDSLWYATLWLKSLHGVEAPYYYFLLVFHRKDLCEAKHEIHSVFKSSDVLFAVKWDGAPW